MKKFNNFALIAGPTASGKSSLALEMAEHTDAIIINADALQVFSEYEVLTARPPESDLKRAPHKLYGHVTHTPYSVGQWLRDVKPIIDANFGKRIIFVGGSGFYFEALLNGLNDIPAVSEDVRANVIDEFNSLGLDPLVSELKEVDPILASRIDLNNPMRVMRGVEVWRETRRPLSDWQSQPKEALVNPYSAFKLVLCPPKEITNARIEIRFHQMLQMGAIDEVKAQMEIWNPDAPANRALGAKEIYSHLIGEIEQETLTQKAIIATRQYAKRQRSWFRSHMRDWHWASSKDEAQTIINANW